MAKIFCLNKQEKLLEKCKEKIIRVSLNLLDELDKFEACKPTNYKKKQIERDAC
jgi:hypothetical protein